jgi:hypothetical protein
MQFQPSSLSNPKKKSEAGQVAGKAATAAAPAAAKAAGGALAAAGGLSAIPVAGWIAAGAIVAGVGAFAIVRAVRKGKAKKADIVKLATEQGIPDAAEVPAFTVRAVKLSPDKREKVAAKLQKQLEKLQGKKSRKGRDKRAQKIQSRLNILAAAEQLASAESMGMEAPADLTAAANLDAGETLDVDADTGFLTPKVMIIGGVVLGVGGLAALFLLRRR